MNKTTAKILLDNLLDRIVVDPETGQGTIAGVLTPKELEALKLANDALEGQTPVSEETTEKPKTEQQDLDDDTVETKDDSLTEQIKVLEEKAVSVKEQDTQEEPEPSPQPDLVPEPIKVEINLDSLKYSEPQDEEVRMCLDFGTAMSKASASLVDDGELYETFPLRLGSRASGGKSADIYPVPSSLWITDDGRIFLGDNAVARSVQADPDGKRQRFDSLKKVLILGLKESSPFNQKMNNLLNPTDVPLSMGEAITFYLGYFIDLACTELEETYKYSRYVSRNFALPSWPQERRAWGEKLLKDMLIKAQIVADTFHGKWDGGIRVEEMKAVFDEISALDKLPEYLLSTGITEPLAVGSSRLRQEEPSRGLAMVVDIGAGTSDIALFVVVENPDKNIFNAFPVEKGNISVQVAGDTLDIALRKIITDKLQMQQSDPHFDLDIQRLQMQIRILKENLFRDGFCTITLSNGRVQVELEEFLSNPIVKRFKKDIADTFKEALNAVSQNTVKRYEDGGLSVVLTGGGAKLPMVQELAQGFDTIHGSQIHRDRVPMVPDMFLGNKEIETVYPQLAVAIGGTMPHLIDEKSFAPDIDIPQGEAVIGKYQVSGV